MRDTKLGPSGKRLNAALWVRSDLSAFGQFQSVLYVNA